MNEKQSGAAPLGMSLGDIMYIVFRHKWKILVISTLGILAALFLLKFMPVHYESEAKLYIRYVVETRAPSQLSENESRIKSPDVNGDSIINTELEILTSRDLAEQVAAALGPERLLGKGHGNDLDAAALVVQSGVTAEVPKESSVIRLGFQHQNPEIVQPVLSQLINSYFKKHAQIHAVGAFDDFLTQETDQLRSRLVQTEDELRKAKAKAGIIALEDTKSAYSTEISRIQQELLDAEAELAERRAVAKEMATFFRPAALVATNANASTNRTATLAYAPVSATKLDDYRRVCGFLDSLRHKEQELLVTFTASNGLVRDVQGQIAANEQIKKQLETDNPGLLVSRVSETNGLSADPGHNSTPDLVLETARANALEAKVEVLTSQLEDIRKRAAAVAEAEGPITELQRRRDLEESHYRKFSENLAQSQLDDRLGAGKVSNISVIEEPTPPQRAKSKVKKLVLGVFFGSLAAAFGLAFLIELYLDQSIRRPAEVESRLGLPLFINIPLVSRNGHALLPHGKSRPLLRETNEQRDNSKGAESDAHSGLEVALWEPGHPLKRYYDALRERLMTYFEMKSLTHKPKLVAVTSCAEGSGVSTTAAELAASLSETGDGNVLLVNMNLQNGVAHHFHKGELACGLETVLEGGQRETALVQENLYVVSEGTAAEKLTPILPKRFKQLVPRLKASDFDYIIFDMPPVSQISVTPRLAKYMDIVLMVVESEKTSREVIQKASALLAESTNNIGVVLNKARQYVPSWLKQEI